MLAWVVTLDMVANRTSLDAYELVACLATQWGTLCKGHVVRPSQ